ncbi:MAG TPA: PqqD family protein [Terriglobales bacterium]|nr:PqqD family protein [Terriglobales bacterium]
MSSVGPANAVASSNLIWRIVDDEALILDLSTGVYFSLNPVATEVWQGLQAGHSITQITADVATTYGVAEDTVCKDVEHFVDELRQAKLWEGSAPDHEQHA